MTGEKNSQIKPNGEYTELCKWMFPWGQSGWGVEPTTHFHLVPRLRMLEPYLHYPIHLHGLLLI
jgi:hypothetical protein